MADESTTEPDLARVEAVLRDIEPDDLVPISPPAIVWDRIAAHVDAASAAGDATVVDLTARRRRRTLATVLAAAAAIVVVVAGVAVVGRGDADVIARAELAHDPGFDPIGADADATAELVDATKIRLASAELPADLGEPADLELWLIEADADGNVVDLVSLGVVGDRAEFPIPDGYDPAVFSVVDISIEPRDGVPTHSGRSILRGPLLGA